MRDKEPSKMEHRITGTRAQIKHTDACRHYHAEPAGIKCSSGRQILIEEHFRLRARPKQSRDLPHAFQLASREEADLNKKQNERERERERERNKNIGCMA